MNQSFRLRSILRARLLKIAAFAALGAPLSVAACGGKVVVDGASGEGGSGGGGSTSSTSTSSTSTTTASGQSDFMQCFAWGMDPPCPEIEDAYGYLGLTCDETVVSEGPHADNQCCYGIKSSPEGCGAGRPFFVAGSLVTAPLVHRAGEGWCALATAPDLSAITDEERVLLAGAWAKDACLEHASVASFGRFSMDLLALGAPADLVRGAHEAALDEVRHATLCFALAGAYQGEAIGPGAFPFGATVMLARDLAAFAASTVIEGCVGETLAALTAAEQLDHAVDPGVREALAIIAADEARHAELAWAAVAWALRVGGASVRSAVAGAFAHAAGDLHDAASGATVAPSLVAHGFMSEPARKATQARALREIVLPCARVMLGRDAEGAQAPQLAI